MSANLNAQYLPRIVDLQVKIMNLSEDIAMIHEEIAQNPEELYDNPPQELSIKMRLLDTYQRELASWRKMQDYKIPASKWIVVKYWDS